MMTIMIVVRERVKAVKAVNLVEAVKD